MITRAYFFGQGVPIRGGINWERDFKNQDGWSITETEAGDIILAKGGERLRVRDAPVVLFEAPEPAPVVVETQSPTPPIPMKRGRRSA